MYYDIIKSFTKKQKASILKSEKTFIVLYTFIWNNWYINTIIKTNDNSGKYANKFAKNENDFWLFYTSDVKDFIKNNF